MRAVQIETRYVGDLSRLRSDILARQAAENGTLSPASRAAFQGKLDHIKAERRRLVRNNDSSSIDSMGRPIRTALDSRTRTSVKPPRVPPSRRSQPGGAAPSLERLRPRRAASLGAEIVAP